MNTATYNKDFHRTVKKAEIPTCNILGVDIAAIDMEWLLAYLNNNIKALAGDYICVSNVHTTVTAYEEEAYRKVQNGGIMAIPDGGPLSSVGQKRGFKNMKRTTGPSLMGEIFKISASKGYRHYFYGSTDETLEKLYSVLMETYPGIQIAGMYSPPFRSMTEEEDKAIVERINETNPDFVWVGLGAPKQEKWMAAHQGKINGLMVGVGAGFDYHAGNIDRAPEWMQKSNLEWVYRLLQDPKRLFRRYWHTNTKFILECHDKGKMMGTKSKKQNILIVHNYYQIPGGEDTVVENEKRMLEEHGHKVILYTRNNAELKRMSKLRKLFLPVTTVFNPKSYKEIKQLIKKENIEVVHVHNTLNLVSPAVYYAAKAMKVPVVQTIHNFSFIVSRCNFYRDGHICEDCVEHGLKCAVKHSCYRGSKAQTLACVLSTWFHRMTGIYGKNKLYLFN